MLGGSPREFAVDIDPGRVQALGLTLPDVAAAIGKANSVRGVGKLEDRHRLYLVLVENRIASAADIAAIPVKSGQANGAGLVTLGLSAARVDYVEDALYLGIVVAVVTLLVSTFVLLLDASQRRTRIALTIVTGVVVGAIFLSSLYLQRVTGASPVQAGLEFLPLAAAITLAATGASKVTGRFGPRTMIAGGLLVMAGGVLLLAASAGGGSYAVDVLPGFLLVGAGVGPMFVAIAIAAMSRVPEEKSGLASGLMMTGHEVGAALGVAALTAVAGSLATRSGLIAGYANAFHATAAALAGLFLLTLLAVPNDKPKHDGHGHGSHH